MTERQGGNAGRGSASEPVGDRARERSPRAAIVEVEELRIPVGPITLYGRRRHGHPTRPTVVLLCGVGFHTFEYEPLAAELAARGLDTLSFDYRGHGRSSGPRGRWSLDDLAGDASHAIAAARTRADGPIVLFGNSLGAMVALLVAAGDRSIAGVAASNGPARIGDFLLTRPRRVLYALGKAVEPVWRPRISLGHFYAYSQLTDDADWLRRIDADPLVSDARRLSIATYRSLLDEWDGTQTIGDVHVPVLLLQGRDDRLQPTAQSERLRDAANPPVELRVLPTGHLPHLDAPDLVAGVLADWIAS